MSAKQIVKAFYDSDIANDDSLVSRCFHKDCQLHWSSSQGFTTLDYKGVEAFFAGTRSSFDAIRFEFSHFLEDDNFVTTRHTLLGNTIENPSKEIVLAYFMAIWEVKDGKLFRCHEFSHKADQEALEAGSFSEIKV